MYGSEAVADGVGRTGQLTAVWKERKEECSRGCRNGDKQRCMSADMINGGTRGQCGRSGGQGKQVGVIRRGSSLTQRILPGKLRPPVDSWRHGMHVPRSNGTRRVEGKRGGGGRMAAEAIAGM